MSDRRARYPAVLALLLLGILLTGAYALSMLVDGQAAYPVHMIGQAQLSAELIDARHIRPRHDGGPAEGRLPAILPVPPAPTYGDGDWAANDHARAALAAPETRVLDAARKLNESEQWDRSLHLYDALVAAHPSAWELALERAHVLSWAGRNADAGRALMDVARMRRSPTIAFEAAQNLWWGNRNAAADSAIASVIEWDRAFPGALALREQVRSSASPSLALAREWARDGGANEQLMYARALVAASDYTGALPVFRRAIALGATDSIRLELAAAANAADSAETAATALTGYLARHPDAADVRLTLARQYAWSERYADAIEQYDRLLEQGHTDAAWERAQTVVWSGDLDAGAAALDAYVAMDSTNSDALRLLGDVQHWRGRTKDALNAYQRVARLQPDDPAIAAQIAAVQTEIENARRVGLPASAAAVRVEAMTDNQGFDFLQTSAQQFVARPWGGFTLTALTTLPNRTAAGMSSASSGFGGEAGITYRPVAHVQLTASVGAQHFTDVATFIGYALGASAEVMAGTTVSASFVHEPAVRRAATLLALQARTVSERIALLASGRLGKWGWSAEAERERLASDLGDTRREAAAASATYPLTNRLTANARVSALQSHGASPSLPGFGALYWSPEHYIESTTGLAYRMQASKGLTIGAGVNGGYAFSKERPGPGARFAEGGIPTFALTADAALQRGAWSLNLDVGYGGALRRGYRSFTTALGVTYALPR